MIKSSVIKIAVLVLLLMVFSSDALFADQVTAPGGRVNFRLRLEDLNTGQGIVITDNVQFVHPWFGFEAGDLAITDSSVTGVAVMSFNGQVGAFFNSTTVAMSIPQDPSTGNISLTLSSRIGHNGTTAGSFRVTLEDINYVYGAGAATFSADLSSPLVPSTCPAGTACVEGGSVTLQTWINQSNVAPDFGPSSNATGVLPGLTIPVGSLALFQNGGLTFSDTSVGPPATSFSNASVPASELAAGFTSTGGPFSLHSQAVASFTGGGGEAAFTLKATVSAARADTRPLVNTPTSVPEPTSLLLLGSGLVALGILRRKKD